ncbi:MAG TPA: MFS transporter [Alphaproteobacteria bacterium]|nr:MFS transporter [Alphaproteobacteria bacterium]
MDASVSVGTTRQDMKVVGLISAGHFMSHFYFMALPPLFPYLRDAFGVSYTELGAMLAAIYATATVTQIPVGFMVDRFGARAILTFGLVMMSLGFALMGLAPTFWVLVPLGVLAATGNSVFHPCDYAILNSSISEGRMGRAFSAHNFSGQIGTAVAPAVMIALANWFSWRVALVAVGLFGIVVMLALTTQWNGLRDDALPRKKKKEVTGAAKPADAKPVWSILLSKQMVIFFMFFLMLAMTSQGMQSFAIATLVNAHGMTVESASVALSAYLFTMAFGVLLGGELVDRTKRHDLVAATVFVASAILTVLIGAVDLGFALLIVAMVLLGIGQGIIRPARDMMLRSAAPKGTTGTVFGYVSSGITAGSALAPIPFGWLIDHGHPAWVFYLIAIFMIVSLVTVATPRKID